MDRSLPAAGLFGVSFGLGTYWLLVQNAFVAAAISTVYAGAAYFYLAFDVSLFGQATRFDDRTHNLGYAIGLFGVSTSPIAFAQYYGAGNERGLPLVVLLFGVIAFLEFASKARHQVDGHV
jgi:NADH:ubiquinone oxidoreductase subunit 6 (subunit J)